MAKEDFQMGAIDLQTYLEIRRIGNYGVIIERIQKEKELAALTGTPFRIGASASKPPGEEAPSPTAPVNEIAAEQRELPAQIEERKQTM